MRVIVYGVQHLDFTTADGNNIKGDSIYCGFENRYVDGLKTNKYFIPAGSVDTPIKPDMELEIYFNEKGKIDSVNVY